MEIVTDARRHPVGAGKVSAFMVALLVQRGLRLGPERLLAIVVVTGLTAVAPVIAAALTGLLVDRLGLPGAPLGGIIAGLGLIWVVAQASRGRLSPGDAMVFLAATASVQGTLAVIAGSSAMIRRHTLLFEHYQEVVGAPADLTDPAEPKPLPPLETLEFDDVWFRYGDNQPWVLRGVSLRIERDEVLAIVGPNGAGKSTLLKLLCRFYDPQRGSIRWNGTDLRDFAVGDLRAKIAPLFQDFMQYDLAAHENIAVGDLSRAADSGAITAAAKRARVHDQLLALPRGYDTMLSRTFLAGPMSETEPDDGVILSGGQWQRLALARALLRQPRDLMLLDEPTSGLDPAAEQDLYRDLYDGGSAQTCLVVTHRAGAVRHADRIVVIENGAVTESGDAASLRAAGGWFATMFAEQGALV